MAPELPPRLEKELAEEGAASLQRGRAVRRADVLLPALVQGAVLGVLLISGVTASTTLAIVVIVASLCLIWAVMSVSASLNAQLDILSRIIVYYAQRDRRE